MKKLTFEIRSPAHQQNAIHAVQQILPEPTPQVLSNAQRSYDALMTDTLVVPSMRRRGDFPVGQGNKYDVFTSDRYYPGDLPMIDGDIPNA